MAHQDAAQLQAAHAMDRLCAAVPFGCRAVLRKFTAQVTTHNVKDLRGAVAAHVVRIQDATRQNEFVDLSQCRNVASACGRLLDHAAALPPPQQAVAFLAVVYFVTQNDGEDDVASSAGFDDDAAVLQAALKMLQLEHLWSDAA